MKKLVPTMNKVVLSLGVAMGVAMGLATAARADYNPIPLLTNSFNADVIIESNAPQPFMRWITASVDAGTNVTGSTLYEVGFNPNLPFSGLPVHGTTFIVSNNVPGAATDSHQFIMPADYTTNDCLFLGGANNPGSSPATFVLHQAGGTLSVAGSATGNLLSLFYTSSGNPSNLVNYVIHHADSSTESGSFYTPDWFNAGAATLPPFLAFVPRGRVAVDSAQFNNLASAANDKVLMQDISIGSGSPVTSVDLTYGGGGIGSAFGQGRSFFFGFSISADSGVTWTPCPITNGYNAHMIVSASVPLTYVDSVVGYNNVTVDNGTNNFNNTFYEIGFNKSSLTTGLPVHGGTVTFTNNHSFTMPSTYVGNCSLFIANQIGYLNGTLTLTTPTLASGVSLLCSAGNGPLGVNYTVNHADAGATETGSVSIPDWFANPSPAYYDAKGRFVAESLTFNNVGSGNTCKIYPVDIAGIRTDSAVSSVSFSYVSGGRGPIFALATTIDGTIFTNAPIASGYNGDCVIEASAMDANRLTPSPHNATIRRLGYVSATMDSGTNFSGNSGNTFYEQGWVPNFPNSGLPHPGQLLTSLADPTKHYRMPTNYTINDAIYIDSANTNVNLVIAPPYSNYSALSFLNSDANGRVTNFAIMQYLDGTSETNLFVGADWFNNTPVAYTTAGRVSVDARSINSGPGSVQVTNLTTAATSGGGQVNPRLYEQGFALFNTGSKVTNVIVRFSGGSAGNSRMVIFAVSGTAGAVPPIFNVQPIGFTTNEGSTGIKFTAHANSTIPVTYQWQGGAQGGGVYTNLTGPEYSGATTTNLTVSPANYPQDQLDYVLIATSTAGSATSSVAGLTLISSLPVVTIPGDTIVAYQPNGGSSPAAETVDHCIDGLVGTDPGKYLNFGANGGAPYVGPTGFIVTPTAGSTIVSVMRLYVANDTVGRDPADFELDGSNDGGTTWATIALGALNLPAGRNAAASAPANPYTQLFQELRLANATGYKMYRWFSTNDKDNTQNSMQIGEVELRGVITPSPAQITAQSAANITNYVGAHPQVFVKAAAFPTNLFYQWSTNGVPVPGATASVYTYKPSAPGVQLADDGVQFTCQVSNSLPPAATSATITLHVIAAPTQSYPVAIMADNPLAWWRLDEPDDGGGNAGATANDYWGGHSGIYTNTQLAVASYNPTEDADTAARFGSVATPNSDVDQVQGLNFGSPTNTSVALSAEAWIRGTINQTAGGGIITYGFGGGGEEFGIDCGGAGTAVRFFFRDASGTSHNVGGTNLATVLDDSGNPTWHHVAAVLNEAATNEVLYWDGLAVATNNLNPGLGMRAPTTPLTIGARSANASSGNTLQFTGDIDEAALYNTPLTPARVLAHYYAAQLPPTLQHPLADQTVNESVNVTFASTAYGPGTLGYFWNQSTDGGSTFNPIGGNTPNLVLPSVTAALNASQYFVVVTNDYGNTTSRVATLTVISGPPVVATDLPATTVVYAGATATLSASFVGTQPIRYQWYMNGNPMSDGGRISGTHTNTLTISNAVASDGAVYQLGATNIFSGGTPTFTTASGLYVEVTPDFNTNGAGWALNGDTVNGGPTINNNVFTMTDNSGGENRSAWYRFPQNVDAFQASWVYQDLTGIGSADGCAFILQNDPRGTTALGGGGGGMGYLGITPSVAVLFNIYAGAATASGSDILFTSGGNGVSAGQPYTSTLPLDFRSANPISVSARYVSGILSLTLQDPVAATQFTTNVAVNIPALVGAHTAYVGMSGSEGGVLSSQTISNFVYVTLPTLNVGTPAPNTVVLTWPSSIGGYQLQSASSLPPAWANDNTPVSIVGNNNQVTVSPANGKRFYRLVANPYP